MAAAAAIKGHFVNVTTNWNN